MFAWKQSTGTMTDQASNVVGKGYAGHHEGLNNPALQDRHGVGPLPQGRYMIGPLLSSHIVGNVVLQSCAHLTPHPENEMFGRAGFLIHGRKSLTDMEASEGCIVLDHDDRLKVLNSEDKELIVVA